MPISTLIGILLILSSFAYYIGRKRAFKVAQGKIRNLHSLPAYYGLYTAIWCGVPAFIILGIWTAFESTIITNLVVADLPREITNLGKDQMNLVINDINNIVSGNIVSGDISPAMQAAADHYTNLQTTSHALLAVVVLALAIIAGSLTLTKIKQHQRIKK